MSNFKKCQAVSIATAGVAMLSVPAWAGLSVSYLPLASNWPSSTQELPSEIVSGNGGADGSPNSGIVTDRISPGKIESETFTAPITFELGAISFVLSGNADPGTDDTSIQLFQLSGVNNQGTPQSSYQLGGVGGQEIGSELLGGGQGLSFTFAGAANSMIAEFDFTGTDKVEIQGGQTYAIELWNNNNGPTIFAGRTVSQAYQGGQAYSLSDPAGQVDMSSEPRTAINAVGARNLKFAVYPYHVEGPSTWAATGGGSWNAIYNWSNGVPNDPTQTASFDGINTSPATVTLDGDKTVNSVSFNSVNSYTIAPGSGGSLILNAGPALAAITALAGTHTISAPIVLDSSVIIEAAGSDGSLNISGNISGTNGLTTQGTGNITLSGTNTYAGATVIAGFLGDSGQPGIVTIASPTALPFNTALSIGGTNGASQVEAIGQLNLAKGISMVNVSSLDFRDGGAADSPSSILDITNNKVSVNYGAGGESSPRAQIEAEIASGTLGLSNGFAGDGVHGQIISSDLPVGEVTAEYDNGSSVLIGNTIVGDTNLDGTVNLTDLLALLNAYGQTGQYWGTGDTNGDGTVNLTDLLALLNNYGQSAATGASVPEPAGMGLTMLLAAPLLTRRRRLSV
jgi:hypothetical protein